MKSNSLKTILTLAAGAALALSQSSRAEDSPVTSGTNCPAGGGKHGGFHHGPKRGEGGNFIEKMSQELNLTPEQQAQIKPIIEASHAQMKAIHEDASLTPEQKMAKSKEVREATHGHIKGILTPEQQQKLQQMKQKRHEDRPKS